MDFKREEKDGFAHVTIDGSVSIYETPALKAVFQECLEGFSGLVLHLGPVTECDVAGIQLLLSARAASKQTGKAFAISTMSAPIIEIMARAGLNPPTLFENSEEV